MNKNKNIILQNLWATAKVSHKGEVYRNTHLTQERRKASNQKPNLSSKRVIKQ